MLGSPACTGLRSRWPKLCQLASHEISATVQCEEHVLGGIVGKTTFKPWNAILRVRRVRVPSVEVNKRGVSTRQGASVSQVSAELCQERIRVIGYQHMVESKDATRQLGQLRAPGLARDCAVLGVQRAAPARGRGGGSSWPCMGPPLKRGPGCASL